MSERKSIIYFSKPGEVDADEAMRAALERAKELNIKDIVVASTRGATALKAVEYFKGYNLVIVPHVWGSKEAGTQELPEETAEKTGELVGKGLKKGWGIAKGLGKGAKDAVTEKKEEKK